jgi:hypothetical protein
MTTWNDLNERQQQYLQAIYETDQEYERMERSRWSRGWRARPADEWRWLKYATVDGVLTDLKRRIVGRNLVDAGTGSTFQALESRGLITCRYETGELGSITLYVRMTPKGRKLVREATGEPREKRLPAGTLRKWQWAALAKLYAAREQGGLQQEDFGGRFGGIGWNTWLRLRDYKPGALIEEYHTGGFALASYWIRLSKFGEAYYEREWQRYRDLYPEVDAPEPTRMA